MTTERKAPAAEPECVNTRSDEGPYQSPTKEKG